MVTVLNQYNEFLAQIRKDKAGTCAPDRFNIFYNEMLLQWKDEQAKQMNLGQGRIDEMSYLKVALDGTELPFLTVEKVTGDHADTTYVKKVDDNIYTLKKPDGLIVDAKGNALPRYWRFGDVYFKIEGNNSNSSAHSLSSSKWIPGKLITEGVKGIDLNNQFTGSNYYQVPFEIGRSLFVFHVKKAIISVKFTYSQMPQLLFFDKSKFEDVALSVNPNFENGKGSVNTNLSDDAKREIVRGAAKMFLENSTSERYQTFSREDYMQKINQE